MTKSYTVIFRTGGTDNAQWRACAPLSDWDAAKSQADEIRKMGYKVLVHDTQLLESIGLPQGYEA